MIGVILEAGSFNLYSFTVFTALGFFIGSFILWRRLRELGLDEEKIIDNLLMSSVSGFIWSRLIYVLENGYPSSGYSFWGAVGGFLASFFIIGKIWKWNFWQIADETVFAILPFAVLSQFGAFLGGVTPGNPTDMPWGVFFPGSLVRTQPVSLFMAISFSSLWIFFLKIEREWRTWDWYPSHQSGFVFLIFLLLGITVSLLIDFLIPSVLYLRMIKIAICFILLMGGVVAFIVRSGRQILTLKSKKQ